MTNDLNTIPASVRDALDEAWEITMMEEHGNLSHPEFEAFKCGFYKGAKLKLCQPSIVIVDLDDEKLVERIVRDYWRNYKRSEGNGQTCQDASHASMKAALAALKER